MISEYSKYIPIERPTNSDAQYFVNVMNQVGQKMETNYQELQTYADQVAGIDIIKSNDKLYFDSRMEDTISKLNDLGTVDLNNSGSVRKAQATIQGVLKDPRIQNSVLQTQKVRRVQNQWSEVQKNPKLQKNWNPLNYSNDMSLITDYINSEDPLSGLSIDNASLYGGENEMLYEAGKSLKESSNDYVAGTTKLTIKSKDLNSLDSQWNSIPGLQRQAEIEYRALSKNNPNLGIQMSSSLGTYIANTKEALSQLKEQEALASPEIDPATGNVTKAGAFAGMSRPQISYLEQKLQRLENIRSMDPEQAGLAMYIENKRNSHVTSFATPSQTVGVNQSVVKNFEMQVMAKKLDLQAEQFKLSDWKAKQDVALREKTFNHDSFIDYANLDLAKQKLDASSKENQISSGGIGLDMNTYVRGVETVPEANSDAYSTWNNRAKELKGEYTQTLEGLLESLDNTTSNGQTGSQILQNNLKSKGINIDLKNVKKEDYAKLLSPSTNRKLEAALDVTLSNLGTSGLSSKGKQVNEYFARLSQISRERFVHDLNFVDASRGTEKMSAKDSRKKINADLSLMGELKGHPSEVDLNIFSGLKSEQAKLIQNSAKGFLDRATIFNQTKDGNIVNYYTTDENPLTGSKVKSQKVNIDKAESKVVAYDPIKQTLTVEALVKGKTKEADAFQRFQIPLLSGDNERFSNIINPGLREYMSQKVSYEAKVLASSETVQASLSTISHVIGGNRLGLPEGEVFSVYVVPLPKANKVEFALDYNGERIPVRGNITSLKVLEQYISEGYNKAKALVKSKNPTMSEKELNALAYKATLTSLIQ